MDLGTISNADNAGWVLPQTERFISETLRRGKVAQALKKLNDGLSVYLNANSPSTGLLLLNENLDLIEELRSLNSDSHQELMALREKLESQSRESAENFEKSFPTLAESSEIIFCEGTVHPTYIIDRAFLELRVKTRQLHCILKTRGGKEFKIGIEPEVVLKEIKSHLTRLHNRDVSPAELSVRINETIASLGSNGGAGVRMKDFVKLYQKNYKVPLDEVIVDLSIARREIPGLKFDGIRNHEDGYQLYGYEEYGYLGFIRVEGN